MSFSEMKGCSVNQNTSIELEIENISGEEVQILVYDDERIKKIKLDNQDYMKSEIIPSKILGTLKIEPGWYHDAKINASLVVFNYNKNERRKLTFFL